MIERGRREVNEISREKEEMQVRSGGGERRAKSREGGEMQTKRGRREDCMLYLFCVIFYIYLSQLYLKYNTIVFCIYFTLYSFFFVSIIFEIQRIQLYLFFIGLDTNTFDGENKCILLYV